jgi:beta-lactamase superfamily II metal-dependent hydrolase
MDYEIDFLPVGEGERSGDAICLRYTCDGGSSWYVGVIDGGTRDSGEQLCQHIREFYQTEVVDFLICTHPDQDHASGLSVVMEELTVRRVLMHCPWDYIDHIFERVTDGRVTKEGLRQRLIENHSHAYAIYEKAKADNIPISHAFAGHYQSDIPCLHIAGPTYGYYLNQVIGFRSITQLTEDTEASIFDDIFNAGHSIFNRVVESINEEALVDPVEDATSAENNSSVITFFDFSGKRALLTGDAGVPALEQAANHIESLGHPLGEFTFFQVPHHGSKRNVGPSILSRLLGTPPLLDSEPEPTFSSFISAAPDGSPKHPNSRVVNALIRRRSRVISTQGTKMYHFTSNMPDRGWGQANSLPFTYEYEDD